MSTENELFGELHEQDENGLFGNEHRRQYEAQQEALSQSAVSGSLPPDELEKSLGSTSRQFTIWHDGGEWLISLKGKEQEQCKTLREWLGGNDR